MADLPDPTTSPAAVVTALAAVVVTSLLYVHRERIGRIWPGFMARRRLRRLLSEAASASASTIYVSSLRVYPVKSLRPVSVDDSTLSELGLAGDRCLMVVRPIPSSVYDSRKPSHRFVTQRQCPSLATIDASLPMQARRRREAASESIGSESGSDRVVVRLHRPGANSAEGRVAVHVDVAPSRLLDLPIRYRAGIWDDVVTVVDVGDEAAALVRAAVAEAGDSDGDGDGAEDGLRVVSILPKGYRRPLDPTYLPPAAFSPTGAVPNTALNDGFPVLIACEASLDELNRRLEEGGREAVPMSRFRPNIVISGTVPFEEDTWKTIWIRGTDGRGGGTILHVVKGCPRCKQSCTDQLTGEQHDEPVATLATFRALGTMTGEVYFAQNAVPHRGTGRLAVGDQVVVLERGDPVWDRDTVRAE